SHALEPRVRGVHADQREERLDQAGEKRRQEPAQEEHARRDEEQDQPLGNARERRLKLSPEVGRDQGAPLYLHGSTSFVHAGPALKAVTASRKRVTPPIPATR